MQAGEAVSFPPLHLSIAQARELIRSREVSAVELVEAALGRIAAGEELNVFRTVLHDSALAQAREVDGAARRGDPLGPLAGIPLALKDNIEVAGVTMTAGTPPSAIRFPPRTRPCGSGCARPAQCWSASCTCRNGRSAGPPRTSTMVLAAIRGIPTASAAGRRAARAPRWPRAWRWARWAPTRRAPLVSRLPSAGSARCAPQRDG